MNSSSEAEPVLLVNRREAIRRLSAVLGGLAFAGESGVLAALEKSGLLSTGGYGEFTAADIAFLDEIAETILPATKTPGAKAAKTGAFMAVMVTDSYAPAEQRIFRDGMRTVDEAMRQANHHSYMAATPPQRLALLTTLDQEQKRVMDSRLAEDRERFAAGVAREPAHYFRMMKELALLGYFTSEVGCTQAMRYIETPGRFDPCIAYTPGEPAWAAHA
ncbi:MAG TPA: gluconate 2-dehydrogenase subunit 3 family protein [Steroidobacteraceae bacterium]|nr:gluconate 2-dehydrogenase subunit 3 family protein [Steroidobacteraceae bacterium]